MWGSIVALYGRYPHALAHLKDGWWEDAAHVEVLCALGLGVEPAILVDWGVAATPNLATVVCHERVRVVEDGNLNRAVLRCGSGRRRSKP